MPRLPPQPTLVWSDDGTPKATAFDDVYFSREGGLAESEAVFLAGCGLPSAWAGRPSFALCELGFGSGLNVLAAWRAWRATHSPGANLHISSIEAFPLAKQDAARALAHFPEVADLAARLLARWPVRAFGPQRLWFPEDGFSLTIHVGDAERVLAGLRGKFDAWFLDGFAPARNAAMWSPDVFKRIAALSAPGARAATFTVAGEVRRGLEAAGFAVEKKPGFGRKRERLEATFSSAARERGAAADDGGGAAAFPLRFATLSTSPARGGRASASRVAILGAGIAGAATAAALTRRGLETIVLDAAPALGAGASGNPAGLIMPRLDRGGPLAEVFLAAYLDAVATYEKLGVLDGCGVEERTRANSADALADLLNDPPLPADWFGARADGAAFHPRAGLVRPVAALERMLAGAELLLEAEISAIEPAGDAWLLRAPDGRARLKADAVVLACGAGLGAFRPAAFLPIELSRGQIEWGAGAEPKHAITQGNYLAPFGGGVMFGATFDKAEASVDGKSSRAENLAALAKLAPDVAASLDASTLRSRAAFRATTQDRAPIAGALPDAERGPNARHEGVYVIGGLGARGLTLAPLLGETIASLLCATPQALSGPALDAIDPARFLHRRARRNG
ncbi:putative peptidase [alpha proteobacterium U9-1i]|nr:putative peptidase [alpha proteobacterium U9-1i]